MPQINMLAHQINYDSTPKFHFSKLTFEAESEFPSLTPALLKSNLYFVN